MPTIPDPHNALFKLAFGDPTAAAVLLQRNLGPEASSVLDWDTITREPGLLIREDLSHRESDLRFSVACVDPIDDDDRVVFLVEHQSTPDRDMAHRSLDYNLRTHEDLRRRNPSGRQPRVYSLLFTHVFGGWTGPHNYDDHFGRRLPGVVAGEPNFELWIDDISFATNRDLQRLPLEPFPKISLWVLRDGRDASRLHRNLRPWRKVFVSLSTRQPSMLASILSYLAIVLDKPNYRIFVQELNMLVPQSEDTTITFREATLQEGRQEGRQQGRQEGLREGLREGRRAGLQSAVQTLIRHKFSVPSKAQLAAIDTASAERLEWLLARILMAETTEALDEVFVESAATPQPNLPVPDAGFHAEVVDEALEERLRQYDAKLQGQHGELLDAVLQLATNKFGRVRESERARLTAATPRQLDRMLREILFADSVDDLIADSTR